MYVFFTVYFISVLRSFNICSSVKMFSLGQCLTYYWLLGFHLQCKKFEKWFVDWLPFWNRQSSRSELFCYLINLQFYSPGLHISKTKMPAEWMLEMREDFFFSCKIHINMWSYIFKVDQMIQVCLKFCPKIDQNVFSYHWWQKNVHATQCIITQAQHFASGKNRAITLINEVS